MKTLLATMFPFASERTSKPESERERESDALIVVITIIVVVEMWIFDAKEKQLCCHCYLIRYSGREKWTKSRMIQLPRDSMHSLFSLLSPANPFHLCIRCFFHYFYVCVYNDRVLTSIYEWMLLGALTIVSKHTLSLSVQGTMYICIMSCICTIYEE